MKPPARPSSDSERRGRMNESKTMVGRQGFKNPGPTDRLRGVEANTDKRKPNPVPEQHGTAGRHDNTVKPPDHIPTPPFRTRSE